VVFGGHVHVAYRDETTVAEVEVGHVYTCAMKGDVGTREFLIDVEVDRGF
jgi:hypothetical protein